MIKRSTEDVKKLAYWPSEPPAGVSLPPVLSDILPLKRPSS